MQQDLEQSIIRIMNTQNRTVGTGFVVADHLAVTCSHVVQAAGSACEQPIHIQFYSNENKQTAQVLAAGWSPPNADDVAFLQLDHLPEGIVPVVLGSAKRCKGHPYHSFGFASLAGYDNRHVNDTLDGVVSVGDKHKCPMLQLKGEEIDKGLSGSPVLDTQTGRVVGMMSEYNDNERTRFAWATTADTLLVLADADKLVVCYPTLQLWPETYSPREVELYLRYLIETNQWLKLPDGHDVLLERIYVSLRADEMNAIEWKSEHTLYLQDLAAIRGEMQAAGAADLYMEFDMVRKAIARHPKMLKHTARDWARLFSEREQGSLSLAEVVQRHAQVVILGDPGSGKTTLGKWLVLQYARALQQNATTTRVRADLAYPGAEADTLLDLGPPRLPIFLRIADYTQVRWEYGRGDNRLPLERFIGQHERKKDLPAELSSEVIRAIAQGYLAQGRALVVLDGLDEVADPDQRKAVMQEVKSLLRPASPEISRSKDSWTSNRVLLTSRIVGYQFDPLTDLPHYTVEEMDGTAIAAFCQAWMSHIAAIDTVEAVDEQAEQMKNSLFDHAHPGVRVLAGNPLLLTILAQVYWNNPQGGLPTTRVALFQEAEQALYQQREEFWDRAGITPMRLTRALAAVAAHIYTHEPTGFTEEGQVRKQLRRVLADEDQVEVVLEAAREVSGFLVARSEGIYGFLHRALQEYFVAQHLVSQSEQLTERLIALSLDPMWREPIVLAVGLLSQPRHPESYRLREVFTGLLEAPDPAGAYLPRRELLAVAACAECEPKRIPPEASQRIAENLLAFYAEREGRGRSPVIRERIRRAFTTLRRSPATAETEVLCAAVQAPDFDRRYAAVDLVIETQWDSPTVIEALVSAWRTYADPAGSLLVALEGIYSRHPDYFTEVWLPMRQRELAHLWERVKESQEWQAILRILYLPPGADVTFEQITRDSPLTEYIVAALRQTPDPEVLNTLRQHMLSLVGQPGTAEFRDAALVLCAWGETSWLHACLQAAGERVSLLRPLLAALAFLLSRALAFLLSRARALELALELALASDLANEVDGDLVSDLFFDLASDLVYDFDLDFDLASDLDLDFDPVRARVLVHARAHALANDLANDLASARDFARSLIGDFVRDLDLEREIERSIQAARLKWANDAALVQQLDLAFLYLQEFRRIKASSEPINTVWVVLITAYTKQWLAPSGSLPSQAEAAETQITHEELTTLVDDLVSFDDKRRERAREVLNVQRQASALSLSIIEQIAVWSEQYAANPQRGTQLVWALHEIVHNRPDWVSIWMEQASMTEETTSAQTILSEIQHVTSETLEMMMQTLPKTALWVKKALLHSISWLIRLRQIPQEHQSLVQERLLVWLVQEIDPAVRCAVIDVLGHWQEQEACGILGMQLLDRLHRAKNDTSEPERAAMYTALARLAKRQPELAESVRAALLKGRSQLVATMALVRLSVSEVSRTVEEVWDWEEEAKKRKRRQEIAASLLAKLDGAIPDPAVCLTALLDAGIDEDVWNDEYHGVLAIAACMQMEHYLERYPNLLKVLLARLQHALEKKDWQARRIALAAVVNCAEVMPTTLLEASQGSLESLLVRGTTDAESFNSRRFALTALSYLRTVTPAVVPALLAGCQDIEVVQQAAIEAAGRFQSIEDDLLPALLPALTGEGVHTAYAITQLLAALGTSVASEAAQLQGQIIEALVDALKHPNSEREVVISNESKGRLEDALYTALLKVAGWTG